MKKLLFVPFILFCTITNAQQVTDLDPLVVAGSLKPQVASRTGRNITRLDGNYFTAMPVHSVDELLRYMPGMEVQSRGAQGSQSDFVIRGATFQQVLVILDGIRLNDPNTGHFNSYIPIAPAEIDHIEILKGAAAAVYGSDAVGGVICIITKSFAATGQRKIKNISAGIAAGAYQTINVNAGAFVQQQHYAIAGGIISNNSSGQELRGTNGFFHNSTASLSAKFFLNKYWSITARTAYDKRDFNAQNFYTTFISDTATEKVTSSWNQLAGSYIKGKYSLSAAAGYKAVNDHYAYNKISIANNNKSYLLQGLVTAVYALNETARLQGGVQYQRKWIRSNDRGDHVTEQAAVFLIWEQRLGRFSYSPSLRADHNSLAGNNLLPMLNISYRLKQLQLRASAGRTMREANFTELYNNYNKAYVTGGSIGNPGLATERSWSYEAGADIFISRVIKIAAGVFRRDQNDLVDWVTTPYSQMPRTSNLSPTGTYALAKNIARLQTSGFESDITAKRDFSNKHSLYASLGVVWLDTKGVNTVPSFYINSAAKLVTSFATVYTAPKWSFSMNGLYKYRSAQSAPALNTAISRDYFIVNAKITASLPVKGTVLFIQADNIFNRNYSDLLGSKMPGRWVTAGVSFAIH